VSRPGDTGLWPRIEAGLFHAYWNRLKAMPLDAASNAGAKFARLVGPRTSANRTARYNMRLAFPKLTSAEERELLDEMWDNLGRLAGEMPHLGNMALFEEGSRAQVAGLEILDRYLTPGVGAVFASGHFANWEVMPAAIVRRGIDCEITYRPANNPFIDKTIVDARADYGVTLFAPKGPGGGVRLMRILKRGGSVALMNDQKYNTGVATTFFGHPCMTNDVAVRLAHRFNVPIQTMTLKRTSGAHFQITVPEPILIDHKAAIDDVVVAGVQRINDFLETTVRAAPGQWFWVHQRWNKQVWRDAGVLD
jgi:Kdo2-lipid IVA lauroyltransferase/acyltransferase